MALVTVVVDDRYPTSESVVQSVIEKALVDAGIVAWSFLDPPHVTVVERQLLSEYQDSLNHFTGLGYKIRSAWKDQDTYCAVMVRWEDT